MPIEALTFPLALVGFCALATNAVLAVQGRLSRALALGTAIVVGTHVALVWTYRYEGSFSQATRNGYVGFLLFHTALLSTLLTGFLSERWRPPATLFSFFTVCVGANGAVFRYDEVALYRWPVIAVTAIAAPWVLWGLYSRRRRQNGSAGP